ELIRGAVAKTFDRYFNSGEMQQIVQWFDLGGEVHFGDDTSAEQMLVAMRDIQGITEKLGAVGLKAKDAPEAVISAAEFVLEGLHAHKKIGRTEGRVFTAGEKQSRRAAEAASGFGAEDPYPRARRPRGSFN